MMTHINDNHFHKPTPIPMTNPPPTNPHRRYRRRTVSSKESSNKSSRNHKKSTTLPILLSLRVPPTLPQSWLVSTSTQLLIEYLLYARGLIPMTVDQLKDEATPNELSASTRRKIQKTRSSLQSLERVILELTFDCHYVLISLGPSFARAREYYVLDVSQLILEQQEEESSTTTLSPHALARRLIPKLIESDTELPSKTSSSYQLWVTVAVNSHILEALWQQQPSETAEWIRRPGFSVPTNNNLKANQRMAQIEFQQRCDTDKNQGQHPSSDEIASSLLLASVPTALHWISMSTSIKGFRL
jgi:hypothetical protein